MYTCTHHIAHILVNALFLCPYPQCPSPDLHMHSKPFLPVFLAADVHWTLQFLKAPNTPSPQVFLPLELPHLPGIWLPLIVSECPCPLYSLQLSPLGISFPLPNLSLLLCGEPAQVKEMNCTGASVQFGFSAARAVVPG